MNKIRTTIVMLWLTLLLGSIAAAAGFQARDLDQMIKESTPIKGQAEILRLLPVQFDARVETLPQLRKSEYLIKSLALWGVNPMPEVKEGFRVQTATGKSVLLYLDKSASEQAKKDFSLGQQGTFYGYHVYNTRFGPGVLISDFKMQPQGWHARLKNWLAQFSDKL